MSAIDNNCNICQKATQSFVDEKSSIIYYHCQSCEYIYKSATTHQDFDNQKLRYNLHQNIESDSGYIAYFQRFLDFILPLVGKPNNALDFGCGESLLLSKLLSQNAIECDYYDPIYHSSQEYKNNSYDLIVSTEVFEHLHNPKEVFGNLISLLSRGGYLAIQTQFHPNNIDEFKRWYYHQDPTHIVFFRPVTFEVLSSLYGCEIVDDNNKNMILIRKIK